MHYRKGRGLLDEYLHAATEVDVAMGMVRLLRLLKTGVFTKICILASDL